MEILAEALELDLVPAHADAEAEAAAAQHIEGGGLLGHQGGLALGQDQHRGGEADLLGAAGEEAEQHERVMIGGGGGAHPPASRIGIGVLAQHMVGCDEEVEPEPLRRLGVVTQDARPGADVANRQ